MKDAEIVVLLDSGEAGIAKRDKREKGDLEDRSNEGQGIFEGEERY